MNPIVRHIVIYATGLISGVVLTLAIVSFLNNDTSNTSNDVADFAPDEVIKTDTVEKVIYKSRKLPKENIKKDLDTSEAILNDTLIYFKSADSIQDLNINKEVLIATKSFKLHMEVADTSKSSLIDSLEQTMGIHKSKSKSIKVEFWKSPLNFEGYILGKNFVRLYGISELENLSFYNIDKKIYMRNSSGTYTLIHSEEYNKFELSKGNIDDRILQISRNG